MQGLFQGLSLSLAEKGFWISDDLVPPDVCKALLKAAQEKFREDEFRRARVGKGLKKKRVENIRKDQIYWVEDWAAPPFSFYAALLEELRLEGRRELYLPLKRFEGHLAHYETGAFYVRHVDRHQIEPHRLLSTVLYLNDVSSGGELLLYKGQKPLLTLKPKQGRFIVFNSELPHEVVRTEEPRWTLTCWMRDDVL